MKVIKLFQQLCCIYKKENVFGSHEKAWQIKNCYEQKSLWHLRDTNTTGEVYDKSLIFEL